VNVVRCTGRSICDGPILFHHLLNFSLNLSRQEEYPDTIKRRKASCNGHVLLRNCLLKPVIEGKMEGRTLVTGRRRRICKRLLDDLTERVLEVKRGSTRSQYVENTHWKRLWTCSKTGCGMNVLYDMVVNCAVLLRAEDLLAT